MEQSTASSGGAKGSDEDQTGQEAGEQGLARSHRQKMGTVSVKTEQNARKQPFLPGK